jgi:DNA-directed RNA polymerase specialized sigma24 family protein
MRPWVSRQPVIDRFREHVVDGRDEAEMADPSVSESIPNSDGEWRRWNEAVTAGRGSAAWSSLLDDLVAFALHQLMYEVGTGTIVRWCAHHFQRPMGPLPRDWAAQDREDIVQDTIVAALQKLIADIDAGKGWDPARGHSLAAYFLDLCTASFPNCLQAWRTKHRQAVHLDAADIQLAAPTTVDPERTVIARDELAMIMRAYGIPVKQLQALIGQSFGLTHADLAAQLQLSPQAVEGLIYRARQRLPRAEGGNQ